MAVYSSVLAWRILWIVDSPVGYSPQVARSQTRLSMHAWSLGYTVALRPCLLLPSCIYSLIFTP